MCLTLPWVWLVAISLADAPETSKSVAQLNRQLTEFERSYRRGLPLEARLILHSDLLTETLAACDELIRLAPTGESTLRVHKIRFEVLADLAHSKPEYLGRLIEIANQLAREAPSKAVAAEADYYAIKAFIMAARVEKMDEPRRLAGAIERYRAHLDDYANSPHRPVVMASLIRCLLATSKTKEAQAMLVEMKQAFPGVEATQRATGEVFLATAVGQRFDFKALRPDGTMIDSSSFAGRILIVHFWASWSRASTTELSTLREIRQEIGSKGVEWLGINLDVGETRTRDALEKASLDWTQYFDFAAFDSPPARQFGVTKLPTYFIVGADGAIVAVPTIDEIKPVLHKLLGAGR